MTKIFMYKPIKRIHEMLTHLETLIWSVEEGKEHSIIACLKEIMKNTKRAKSLYISLIEESSERLEAAEEMIAILKKAITNSVNG